MVDATPPATDEKRIRQLLLVRYYLTQASGQYQIEQEPAQYAAINLLHEALEATLIASADHLNASVNDRTTIDTYLTKIEERLRGAILPFRTRVLQFNRARVSAKHALTLPDKKDLKSFFEVIPQFIEETVRTVFDVELEMVSLLDLVQPGEIKDLLQQATNDAGDKNYYESLVNSRRAFYVMFEKSYDISPFAGKKDHERYGLLDDRALCNAPFYAKSDKYIQESVRRPFDYIVLDHSRVDAECLKKGIDTHTFWNIWRLTPKVWRKPSGDWVNQYDLDIANAPSIKEDANYVIEALIGMQLQLQTRRSLERYRQSKGFHSIGFKPGAPLYRKASASSAINGTLPQEVDTVHVTGAVPGLDSEEWFWEALYLKAGGPFLGGFLRAADAVGDLTESVNPFDFGQVVTK